MKRLVLAALTLAYSSANAQTPQSPQATTPRVVVTDLGAGGSGRILQQAVGRPHRLVEPDSVWFILGRGAQERSTLVVLGRSAAIGGKVEGDVIVVGGDLYVRSGAEIVGRAIAIGGGVYPSTLAHVGQGTQSFRDNTFDIQRTPEGYRLSYRSLVANPTPPLLLPGIYGLRMPSYDRVNGVSVRFGPTLTFGGGRGEAIAIVTYRSDLGKIDPAISAGMALTRRLRVAMEASRGTFTNDAWIWGNFTNSFSTLVFGTDTRNYYRADRAELTLHRLWESTTTRVEPFIGVLGERAWSVGPAVGEQRGPWSAWGRTDSLGMWRPNPSVASGDLRSALAGGSLLWESNELRLRARTRVEVSEASPTGGTFNQVTSDLDVSFPTFGEQEYEMDTHWVTTFGDTPPPQRFVYFGGSGTMPFLDLLSQGGGELLLVDQRYAIPLPNVRLGFLGIPTVQLRHRIGSAGVGSLPSFEQMIGLGVMLTIIRGEVQLDPNSGKVRFSVGFTFSR